MYDEQQSMTMPRATQPPPAEMTPGRELLQRRDPGLLQAIQKFDGERVVSPNELDSSKMMDLHTKLLGLYAHELDAQYDNRLLMARDEAFYDHHHYTAEELETLAERGQAAVVYNLAATSVNWVLGTQRRAVMDYKILARREEGVKAAQTKTDLIKYLRDENRSEFEESLAFKDAVRAGIGWMETGQGNAEDGNIILDRHETWRAMLWDSTARKYDLNDARYMARTKWMDIDLGIAKFPNRATLLRTSANNTATGLYFDDDLGDDVMDEVEQMHFEGGSTRRGMVGYDRSRARAIEMWFKMVSPAIVIKGGQFNGQMFDEWSPGHWKDVAMKTASLSVRPREVIHCAVMTDGGFLSVERSPYRHNRYPFTPFWGYRSASNNLPYGLIRGIIDINRDLNKRMSKALHHMSTTRVIVENGAVDDIEMVRDEAARPDGVITYNRGFTPPQIQSDTNIAAAHIQVMEIDARMIQQVAGVTDANLGRESGEKSGVAIKAKQSEGALTTSEFFENHRQSRQIHGEKLLGNTEQFYTDEDVIRLTDDRGRTTFKPINDGNPDNDIAETKANFIVSDADWRASTRQAQAEEMIDLIGKMVQTAPDVAATLLPDLIRLLDIENKDEVLSRVYRALKMPNPDEDPNNPSPETQAMLANLEKEQKYTEALALANLAGVEAKAKDLEAKTRKTEASIPTDAIAQLRAAFEAALALAQAPMVAPAADAILAAASTGEIGTPPQPAMPPQQQMPPDPAMMGAGAPPPQMQPPQPQPATGVMP